MLFPDKSSLREKLNNHVISLKYIEKKEFDLTESYTTNNILSYKSMISNYEYTGIPSRTSFMEMNQHISNKEYFYGNFDNRLPENSFNWQPIIYTINKMREIPFLLYLLKNNENEYKFIDVLNKKEKLIENVIIFLSKLIGLKLKYSGFIIYNNVNYLFFEYPNEFKEIDGYNWSLISEIINYEKIYDLKINNSIKNLLLNNSEIINIYNVEKTSIYEIPCVCYFLTDNRNGHQLYCSDYDNLSRIVSNIEKTEKINYYISRCALFNGIIKYNIHNTSNINKHLRYSDSNEYNSVYNLYTPNVNEIYLFVEIDDKQRYLELSRLVI